MTSETLDLVLDLFRRHLAIETLGPDDNFFEYGGDSSRATQLVHALSRSVGTQIPTDILFQYPTPRHLAAFLQPDQKPTAETSASVVNFSRRGDGLPVFLIPALYPSPWVFLPLVEAMNLARPIYGLRSPELDWRADVLDLGEMVTHYVTEIRRLQPRGPYTLIGYSFGGMVAFDIATRLAIDDEVRDLILLDTDGPRTTFDRWRRAFDRGSLSRSLLSFLCRRQIIGARGLTRVGLTSPLERVALAVGAGPLSLAELRVAMRLVQADVPGIDAMTLEELCAELILTLKALVSPDEWAEVEKLLPLHAEDPVSAIKAYKVLAKNLALARSHRSRAVFRGGIAIFATEGHRDVLRWGRHSSHPLRVTWVPAKSYRRERRDRAHLSFLDNRNVPLYAGALKQMLDVTPARGGLE